MRAQNYSPASLRTIQYDFNINQGDLFQSWKRGAFSVNLRRELPIPINQSETSASTPTISKVVTWLFEGEILILGENLPRKSSNTSDMAH